MSGETPFSITVPDDKLSHLERRLEDAAFPKEVKNSESRFGVPLKDIRDLVKHWKSDYDWREQETWLNDNLPQFRCPIEVEGHGTLKIHYVHKRSSRVNGTPLLFVHGWPGSFIEVKKIIDRLTAPGSEDTPTFHVVAIDLPGFGFSQAPKRGGFGIPQHAETAHKLMLALGYNEYGVQGEDWGHTVIRTIVKNYGPAYAKAWHGNFPIASPLTFRSSPLAYLKSFIMPYTKEEKAGLERAHWWSREQQSYFSSQASQTKTLAFLLEEASPGLLPWMYKLIARSGSYGWEKDEILTWVSIYIFSSSGPAASLGIYYEATHEEGKVSTALNLPLDAEYSIIPMGVSYFPKQIRVPASRIRKPVNLRSLSRQEKGGHFAAYECPERLISDLRRFFGRGGAAAGVVEG